jgi:FkbM family methyltransferase
MNHLRQVTALPVAAGAATGWLTLIGFDETLGNFGLSHVSNLLSPLSAKEKALDGVGGQEKKHSKLFRVSTRPLDELLSEAEIDDVDFLKMDIEGAEGIALRGMADSLSRRRVRRLLLELHPKQLALHGHMAPAIIRQLLDFGYLGWRIDHTPHGNRRAAYRHRSSLSEILQPLDPNGDLDAWPHLFWVSPEVGWI